MKKSCMKILAAATLLCCMLLLVACGGEKKKEEEPTQAPTNTPSPTDVPTPEPTEPPRDLKGLEVTIIDWWSGEGWNSASNAYGEAYFDMLAEAETKHNFKFDRRNNGTSWGNEYKEKTALTILENRPDGMVYLATSSWIGSFIQDGVCMDLSGITTVNWDDDKWNQAVRNVLSVNGGLYGFYDGSTTGTGVFFNKDLLNSMGISPDSVYDLQKNGKWNWENFTKFCESIKTDTNNDGKTDIWPVSGREDIVVEMALYANGTGVIGKNEKGLLKVNSDDPAVLESFAFLESLKQNGYLMSKPKGDGVFYDWSGQAFKKGECVMYIAPESACTSELYGVEFAYGFVTFPYGPAAGKTVCDVTELNVMFIPNCAVTKDVADDIMFAMDIFCSTPDGMTNNTWRNTYEYRYKDDARLVNETIYTMLFDCNKVMPYSVLLPGFDHYGYTYDYMNGAKTEDLIVKYVPTWQEQVDKFNAGLTQ